MPSQPIERWELTYKGRVQGVGFRYRTVQLARKYDVTGFVKNQPDGTVLLVLEGTPDEMGQLVEEIDERMQYYIHSVSKDCRTATGQFRNFEVQY